jgi:Nif-specific regulatory protein
MANTLSHTNPLIGSTSAIRAIYEELLQVSQSKATVLLRGESGTGKELVAQLIHKNSSRSGRPFIKVSCAALPETLLESELFGHERGAFTGALKTKKGRFELADGGTIFLDEIGDLSLPVQVKLLQVLQEGAFERVGGVETLTVDVRIVSATHRNLETAIHHGTFREDLYYRLNVIPILLPPLRQRREDVVLLTEHFLKKFNEENRKSIILSEEINTLFLKYDWPGNVRELENCIERLVVLAQTNAITMKTIPPAIRTYFSDIQKVVPSSRILSSMGTMNTAFGTDTNLPVGTHLMAATQEMEREAVKKALERSGGVQAKAARLLGITARQIAYKIKKYKLGSGDGRKPMDRSRWPR